MITVNKILCYFVIILLFMVMSCDKKGEENDDDHSGDDSFNDDDTSPDNVTPEPPDGTWIDYETGLMWQNPGVPSPTIQTWFDVKEYCENLELAEYGDWRLPTISELRTLIRDCAKTIVGGECHVTDECTDYYECKNNACSGCSNPGSSGEDYIFWPSELIGEPYYNYWSATEVTDIEQWVYIADYYSAAITTCDYINTLGNFLQIRCVRTNNVTK
ncbi:MAG: DUF1566 domain-containing protein [Myxococcales bacterium]|nr:DUF1566 domain-containing protein [Myxococcales bacterium]